MTLGPTNAKVSKINYFHYIECNRTNEAIYELIYQKQNPSYLRAEREILDYKN
jgi:hypothetical protein